MTGWWKSFWKRDVKDEEVEIPTIEEETKEVVAGVMKEHHKIELDDLIVALRDNLEEEYEDFEDELNLEEELDLIEEDDFISIRESDLRDKFKGETGKNVIWRDKITVNYTKFKENFLKRTGKKLINDITEDL